jgi:hypothetical protein
MLPTTRTSTSTYPVTCRFQEVSEGEGSWKVSVGADDYDFGADEAAAQAFATAASSTAALVEWATRAKQLLRQMEGLLAEAGLLRVMYDDNELLPLLLATPQGAPMPGIGLPLRRLLGIGCLFQDLTAFLAQNVVGVPPAPIPLGVRRVVMTLRD